MMIAGHTFAETKHGRRCTAYVDFGGRICGASWLLVRTATAADVDQPGFAHSGKLSLFEFGQIQAEKAAEDARVWEAVLEVATGDL